MSQKPALIQSFIHWVQNSSPHIWVLVLSLWGGLISYFTRLRTGVIEKYSTKDLILELGGSAFSGIITFYLCSAADFNQFLTAAVVGVSGHMGSRLLTEIERAIIKRIKSKSI